MNQDLYVNILNTLPFGMGYLRLLTDSQGGAEDYLYLEVNPAFEQLTGLRREDILGKKASEIFGENKLGAFDWIDYCSRAARSGKVQETTQWIKERKRYDKVMVIPLSREDFVVVIRDATAEIISAVQKEGNSPLPDDLEAVFNHTHDAISLVEYLNGGFRYIRNNAVHKRMTGFSDISGLGPVELLGEETGGTIEKYYERCMKTGRPLTYEQVFHFAPGKCEWQTEVTPILGDGTIRYLLCTSQDVTDLKAAQKERDILARRLQSTFDQHNAVMLVIDPDSGRIVDANPAACTFYGYTKEELLSLNIDQINMLPSEQVSAMYRQANGKKRNYFLFPHRLKNGEIRPVDVFSCPIEDGEKTLLSSIIFDVSDREEYRGELYREKELLRTTLQSIGDGVVTTDSAGRITSLNSVAQELTGWKNSEAKGKYFSEVFILQNEETGAPAENLVRKVLETGRIIGLANHTELIDRKGRPVPIADSAAPIKTEDGEISGVVMVFRDISNERDQNRQIRFLSYHDYLTGLYNRRYMEEAMILLDTDRNLPLSVVMGDVNGLKITNDVFGHEAGDNLLRHIARLFEKNCRREDIIARWGGDEFVVIMPRTGLDEADQIIRRIKRDHVEMDESGLRLSLSLGCAVRDTMDRSIRAVLREAEGNMYQQKLLDGKSSRNAIINTLLATLYEKSMETEGHAKRMETQCHCIGRSLQLSSKELDELSLLAVLHDIGKVAVNPAILKKPGQLTAEEWAEMKRHPEIGYRIAQATPELANVADFILSHHERWDGKGYPRGLREKEIPLLCRILAVTDAYDAMTNDRVYRKAKSSEEALSELEGNAGTQFDPEIVRLFIQSLQTEGAGRASESPD
ncbi:diguanylate cyclase and metal dependent phosphohydrolase [Syntrophobotulus glycolicus DSM 8271]|uniref:Diguanylate cyclase and metal dependent phosphohydrolase n=1 Tax=Syntrophobotulus glycolicus (strain DSM 8271 / FlGlyR) TaxID=645991 RepID=F0SUK8_SYNGF|nr:PAS domain S-box protein [Syntrophobotulus glycolicus]ADY55501.1 diguanylate cyclase and metal dependent phosphohydrolase [Syntrophobotulus glycolicus DSM 8271]